MKRASWKTTAAGILTILLTVLAGYLRAKGYVDEATLVAGLIPLAPALGLLAARDNSVTSEQAGAAKKAEG